MTSQPPLSQPPLTGTAVPEILCSRLEGLAANVLGRPVQLCGWRTLNSQPFLRVARLTLAATADPEDRTTLIAKFLEPQDSETSGHRPSSRQAGQRFANERAQYRTLLTLAPERPWVPRLLAEDGDMVLFEDLGERHQATPDAAIAALIPTLADLHAATAHLPAEPDSETRRERDRTIRYGLSQIADQGQILLGQPLSAFLGPGEAALALLDAPGPFRALVHADLADLRQIFWTPDRLWLLDLEFAHVGHALFDVAVLSMGKAEFLQNPPRLMHNHIAFSGDVAAAYRQARLERDGLSVPDAVWAEHLAAALLCAALYTIAQFHRLPDYPGLLPLARAQRQVMLRLLALVPPDTSLAPLMGRLHEMTRRIF